MSHHFQDRQHNGSCRGVSNHFWFIHPFLLPFYSDCICTKRKKRKKTATAMMEKNEKRRWYPSEKASTL
jgi:hypothetical protein